MGVKDLWTILSPVCEKKPLWTLQDKTIAIDLSAWVVDSQNVGDKSQKNMYLSDVYKNKMLCACDMLSLNKSVVQDAVLCNKIFIRNLFFRTSYLLLLGVKPIFILEGAAPELKYDTIARRQKGNSNSQHCKKNGSRSRLTSLQKQCQEFLSSLGVSCIQGKGEAEALCAKLNEIGVVDGVISQDSDCLLYGARTVYRNFTMSPSFTCDVYEMSVVEEKLGLGRNKLLALSLLCGCDYQNGVYGVGKENSLKFLSTVPESLVLQRLKEWRTDDKFDELEVLSNRSQLPPGLKAEVVVRKKALQDPNFPSLDVINEYLNHEEEEIPSYIWCRPNLHKFLKLADIKLNWKADYAQEKFIPLLTRWHLVHNGAECDVEMTKILKKRNLHGVRSYEVQWSGDELSNVVTIEPEELVAQVYTKLHEEYVLSKTKPKKASRRKKTPLCDIVNIQNMLNRVDITPKETKQPTKKRIKKKPEDKGLQKLDKFIIKQSSVVNVCPVNSNEINEENKLIPICESTPSKVKTDDSEISFHYNSDCENSPIRKISLFSDKKTMNNEVNITISSLSAFELDNNDDDINLSDIVNSIISREHCNPAVDLWMEFMA